MNSSHIAAMVYGAPALPIASSPSGSREAAKAKIISDFKARTGEDLVIGRTIVYIDTSNEAAQFRTAKGRSGRPLQAGRLTMIGHKYINFQSGDQPGPENLVIAIANSALKVRNQITG
jgi:hypothetical protein